MTKLPIYTAIYEEECNIRTYVNIGTLDYLNKRFYSKEPVRMAILPFDVPETFAPLGNESANFGRTLANLFHQELVRTGEVSIIEVFNRDRWPGKRADFVSGNYEATQVARLAGYDIVLVGYMEPITNSSDLVVSTKLIDTANNVTLFYGQTRITSHARDNRQAASKLTRGLVKNRPELFNFEDRALTLAKCTTNHIIFGPTLQDELEHENKKWWDIF